MNDLIRKIIELSNDQNNLIKIEELIEKRLEQEPNNIELWLRLALLELAVPLVDINKSIMCLKKILSIEKENVNALLILAYIYTYDLGGMDENLFDTLNLLQTFDPALNSMLKYAASWFYIHTDREREKKLLQESIEIHDKYVWHYIHLARIYFLENQVREAQILINKALNGVVKIYVFFDENKEEKYDMTNVEEFINERIKGIYLTDIVYKGLQEELEKFKEK